MAGFTVWDQGGFPFSYSYADSLTFWYKYATPGVDTGMALIGFKQWDAVGDSAVWNSLDGALLPTATNWTRITIPINPDTTKGVDSAIVIFTPSKEMFGGDDSLIVTGSTLLIDDMWIHWKCGWTDTLLNFFAMDSADTCDGYLMDPGLSGYEFLWSNGDTMPTLYVTDTGWTALTISDTSGCSVTDSIFITLWPCPGFEDGPALFNFSVFPNPVLEELNVEFNLKRPGLLKIALFGITGSEYFRLENQAWPGINQLQMNVSELHPGMYFLKLEYEGESYFRKIVRN